MNEARYRLDPVQFGVVFTLCKSNPILGYKLGYVCSSHMKPDEFIRRNGIEMIDSEQPMVQVIDFDKLVHGELEVVGG